MNALWRKLAAGERTLAVNVALAAAVVVVDLLVEAAFPKFEDFLVTGTALVVWSALAVKCVADTDWYDDLTG